jgi:histone H3/H4
MTIDDLEKFKDQKLPLARIKKIMKSDEDVRVSRLILEAFYICFIVKIKQQTKLIEFR